MEIINNINEALELISQGLILVSINQKNRSYFAKKKDKIYIQNSNSSYSVSIKEFILLFSQTKFIIYETDNTNIDLQKDEEYYNWSVLKK